MNPLRKLLVPIDGAATCAPAVDLALRLAGQAEGEVRFCHSVDLTGTVAECTTPYAVGDVGPILEALEDESKSLLASAAAKAAAAGVRATTSELVGSAVPAILDASREGCVDAIVMGTHGRRGMSRFFLGSVAEGILRGSDVPVFVTTGDANIPFSRIAVALDDWDPADAALDCALRLACPGETTIVLTHVVNVREIYRLAASQRDPATAAFAEERSSAARLLEKAASVVKQHGVAVEVVILEGEPVESLIDLVRTNGIDLLAIGTHGRRGIRRLLLGSVAEGVIRESPVPVVVVRRRVALSSKSVSGAFATGAESSRATARSEALPVG